MKNQMIRKALTAVATALLFLSCSKEKDAEYFIKFKVDGQEIEFTKAAFIVEESSNPDKVYIIVAGRSADLKKIFTVDVEVPKEPQTGTYTSENDMVALGYGISGTPSMYYTMWPVTGQPVPSYTLTITSMTETEIRGHFIGNYLADEEENSIVVSEGEFVAKLTE